MAPASLQSTLNYNPSKNPLLAVARAHFEIRNVTYMYHRDSSSCNTMETTILREMRIQTIIASVRQV
jgi:hypothetical protein